MSAPRTVVYVADHGLVKADVSIRIQGVRPEGHPAVVKYPEYWRVVGTVDAADVATIEMLGDSATLPRLWERIRPIPLDHAEPTETTAEEPTSRMEAANAARSERTARRVASAKSLRADGLSVAQIAIRMASDEGLPKPFPPRTVERWLGTKPRP